MNHLLVKSWVLERLLWSGVSVRMLVVAICFVPIGFQALAQSTISGYVFVDGNQNGKKDRREQGLVSVGVTNGVDVVLTDQDGFYELPVGEDNIIAVIKPSGFSVPVDEHHVPRNYYIHKPHGSPTMEYEGVSPTGELPRIINFPLLPSEETDEFRFLVFGDPQMSHPEDIYYFKQGVISELVGVENVSFGLSLGDIVGNRLEGIPPYIEAVGKIGVPWYNTLGNHDINFDVDDDHLSDETFERLLGPANYAFNYGGAHFVVLDNVMYPSPKGTQNYTTGMREDQWLFLQNNLKHVDRAQLLVLACHIPLWTFNENDRKRLYDLLDGFEHLLFLSAHTHVQQQVFHGQDRGWYGANEIHEYNVGTTCGDWYSGELDHAGVPQAMMRDGTPKGYAFVTIKGNAYEIDYKVAGQPIEYQMRLFVPKVVRKGRNSYGFYANFFMGSKRDDVSFRINGGNWTPMDFTPVQDPTYVTNLYKWDQSDTLLMGKRSFYRATNSSHLWYSRFPRDLPVGEHKLEVSVTDMFGRTHTTTASFRVEEPKPEPILQAWN